MDKVRTSHNAAARRRVNRQLDKLARAERRALTDQLKYIKAARETAAAVDNKALERLARAEAQALDERLRYIKARADVHHSVFLLIAYAIAIVACAVSFFIVLAYPYITGLELVGITYK